MVKCCYPGCTTRNNKRNGDSQTYSHHNFPKKNTDEERYLQWLDISQKKESELPKQPNFCSLHFPRDCFDESLLMQRKLSISLPSFCPQKLTLKRTAVPVRPGEAHNFDSIFEPGNKIQRTDFSELEITTEPIASSTPYKTKRDAPNRRLNFTASTSSTIDFSSTIISNVHSEHLPDCDDESESESDIESELECDDNMSECGEETLEVNSDFFLVQKSQLLELFAKCRVCGGAASSETLYRRGSLISIQAVCNIDSSHVYKWQSQKTKEKYAMGNVALSSSVFLSGMSFSSFDRFTKTLGMPSISASTYYRTCKKKVSPVLRKTWIEHREQLIAEENIAVRESGVGTKLVQDGQYDSPGFSAYAHTYTAKNVRNDKVMDLIVMKKNPKDDTQGDLETKCCYLMVTRLDNELDNLESLCTDRHPEIIKLIKTKYSHINHAYDVWHIAKSFKKRLAAAVKISKNKALQNWMQPIMNHLWYCCANCDERGDILVEKFVSLLRHIRGVHCWNDGENIFGCEHDDYMDEDDNFAYLDEKEDAYITLQKLVEEPKFLSDLRHACHNIHTGALESYHNLRLMYLPKRISFSHATMVDKGILAALDNNSNVGREIMKEEMVFSKVSQRYVWRKKYTEKSNAWRLELHKQILDVENTPQGQEYSDEINYLFCVYKVPKISCRVPRPVSQEEMPPRRLSRFN